LVTNNKFDFYKITEISSTKYQILDRVLEKCNSAKSFHDISIDPFLIKELEKDIEKYKSKLLIMIGDFFLSDLQITKQDKDWLYPQMINAIKTIRDSIILVFSPMRLSNLVNYGY